MKKFVRYSAAALGLAAVGMAILGARSVPGSAPGTWLAQSFWDGTPASLTESWGDTAPEWVAEVFRRHLRKFPKSRSSELAQHLLVLCRKHSLEPALVLALIHAESSFRTDAVSYRGAVGLMQIMPATARYVSDRWGIPLKGPEELFDPFKNLSLGVAYLAYLRDRYESNLVHMLAAYNLGPGRVDELMTATGLRLRGAKRYVDTITRALFELREPRRGPAVEASTWLKAMGVGKAGV
ncbi:MAG: lytic transglycosylase domain-containing protein [Bdellovibrionales bacterium]|nr:lytic transglycosylase domain-containing protein [Bdellovibrionales bacterium]